MKRSALTLLLVLLITFGSKAFGGIDIRLGVSAGTNFSVNGDVKFMFFDIMNANLPKLTTENLKYNSINPNIGVTVGLEFMLSQNFSIGFNNYLGYQQEGFTVDMKGQNFDAIGKSKMHGLSEFLSFYVAYYPINRFSLNLGAGVFYEGAFSDSPETEMIKGQSAKNDIEGDFSFAYAAGLQGNFGFTYHLTNHCFINLTGYYNAVKIMDSNEDMEKIFADISNPGGNQGGNPGGGSNPGGGGLNPGGGGLNPGGLGKALTVGENINVNYISNGIWYEKQIPNRLTVLFTIGYRF